MVLWWEDDDGCVADVNPNDKTNKGNVHNHDSDVEEDEEKDEKSWVELLKNDKRWRVLP